MKALEEMFIQSLEDMYDAEQRIAEALPDLIAVATCPELKLALQAHLAEAENHIERLMEVFEALGKEPRTHNGAIMARIVDEANELATKGQPSHGLNTAIVAAGQRLKHYEMATYGCLQRWAKAMDQDIAAAIITEILDSQRSTYHNVSDLAFEKDEEALELALC